MEFDARREHDPGAAREPLAARRARGRAAWRAARTFDDLLALGAEFIAGRCAHFPGWGAPDTDPETDAIRGELVDLHALGLLTVASQPAFDGERDRRLVRQRAFVAGFARPALARRLACAREVEVRVWDPTLPCSAAAESRGEPVTLEDGLARVLLPGDARAEELALFATDLAPEALEELSACAFVAAFDPVFGRDGRLFSELLCLGRG